MNWITRWKKIGIKVKQIFKKQSSLTEQEVDWKSCPLCKKLSYIPDLLENLYICECSFHFDLPPKIRLDNLLVIVWTMFAIPLDHLCKTYGRLLETNSKPIDSFSSSPV